MYFWAVWWVPLLSSAQAFSGILWLVSPLPWHIFFSLTTSRSFHHTTMCIHCVTMFHPQSSFPVFLLLVSLVHISVSLVTSVPSSTSAHPIQFCILVPFPFYLLMFPIKKSRKLGFFFICLNLALHYSRGNPWANHLFWSILASAFQPQTVIW